MPINFDDIGQMMHQGQRIPIDTPETFEAVHAAANGVYTAAGVPWDADAQQQLESRVLGGMNAEQIIAETLKDRNARFP
jgi:hypothetical protein